MIEAAGLRRAFGSVVAVDGVSFRADDGCITGLLGPNGAGKTSTLRMLYGLLRPDAGHVLVDGINAGTDPLAVQRRLGVLSDQRGLYSRLSVRENIVYYARLHGLSADQAATSTDELIAALDMHAYANRRGDALSQGQRVKTAIARALVHSPPNLVLDEPTNGLDVMATRSLRRFLVELRDAGRCIVFSTHVMQEVAALCDVVIVIAEGRVVATGSPQELRQRTGCENLEDAFVSIIGSGEGLMS